MKRAGSDVWALVTLIVLFGVMSFLIAGHTPQMTETVPHRTTYSARSGGFKAAYLLLKKRGISQIRCDTPPGQWPRDARVMVTATPWLSGDPWSDTSAQKALDWVEQGNTLIVLSDEKSDLGSALKVRLNTRGVLDETLGTNDASPAPAPSGSETLAPRQPSPLFADVRAVKVPGADRFSHTPEGAVTLLAGAARVKPGSKTANASQTFPLLLAMTRGKGRIFVFSTPTVWQNKTLALDDNARLLVQIVEGSLPANAAEAKASVAWDEYHQGYSKEQSLWTVVGLPGQLSFYQIVAVSLLAVYAASRRFGLPRPLPSTSRVSSEYVASLADLYNRAGATDAALLAVYQAFRRDLCRAIGVSTDTDEAQIARQAAALADPVKRADVEEKLRRLFADCAVWTADQSNLPRREQKRLRPADLLSLTQQMETFRRDLSIGRAR